MPKRLDENPTIADQIIIDLECPDADGCFIANPYKVDNVSIYYVQRSFTGNHFSSYDKTVYDSEIQSDLNNAIKAACNDASDENLAIVERLRTALNSSARVDTFYYSDARAVAIFGDQDNPAWLSADSGNAVITNIEEDENGDATFGLFELEWNPTGLREGDYFVCWTWTPNPAGDSLSSHVQFSLGGATQLTTSIPTHSTDPNKYPILMERYLPSMFKTHLGTDDLSPETLQELNLAVGKGFAMVEDMANQIVDLVDANSTHESLLPFLSNLFHIKLRTNDPTLWRRQIKQAVPLFKRKGTFSGLENALSQAGITLNRLVRLWQVVSKYTYQEHFLVSDSLEFTLSKTAILPIDQDNFELYYRIVGEDTWSALNSDYVTFTEEDSVTTMSWIGDTLSYNPIELAEGDSLRVVYQIVEVPSVEEQTIEDYIRDLPLSDQRDEQSQTFPPKNWNVRVIEEDDALLDVVIPTRHPFHDPLIYGWVRTLFPYSENIYNMEEYNGSTRESTSPCDIGPEFLDPCGACLGSKFVVDLEIENLSTDRILEANEIIKEFVPFHAVLHAINLTGGVNDLIQPPVERIGSLVNIAGEEFTISGNSQVIFNRSMTSTAQFKRDELSNVTTVASSAVATAYNEFAVLYSPFERLDEIALDSDPTYTYLEVLAPSNNAGTYGVEDADGHHAVIASGSLTEPLDQGAFTFRLSNERASATTAAIYQDDVFQFSDTTTDFYKLNVRTQWDVENSEYDGGTWTVSIAAYSDEYEIKNILPSGALILADPSHTLPTSTTTGITYVLKDDDGNTIATTDLGKLTVTRRGRVDLPASISIRGSTQTLSDVRSLMDSYHGHGDNHYVKYLTTQYPFGGFVEHATDQFYILNYTSGDVAGVTVTLYQRLIDGKKGYFNYKGLKLVTSTNYETSLNIQNGENADSLYPAVDGSGDPYTLQLENNSFFENFLILIGTDYYAISRIDGNSIWIIGPDKNWKTTGTALTLDILQYEKAGGEVEEREYPPMPGHDFTFIDRRGNEVIESDEPSVMMLSAMLNAAGDDQILDMVGQQEGIGFSIKMKDGSTQEGEI